MESGTDVCACETEGRRHKRSCLLSYRNHWPGRTLFPATSNGGQLASSSALDLHVDCSPSLKGRKDKNERRGSRLHSLQKYGQLSSPLSHCWGVQWSVSTLLFGWYSDHFVELTSLASGASISLDRSHWEVLLTTQLCLIVISRLHCGIRGEWGTKLVAGQWCLQSEIVMIYFICAAQMLLLPTWQDCNLLYWRKCVHFKSTLGSLYRLYTSETTTGGLCTQLVVKVGLSTCTTACINVWLKSDSNMVHSQSNEMW